MSELDELKMIKDTSVRFSCGCKEWLINESMGDKRGVKAQPDDTVVDHGCSKIVVYRKHKGLTRYFQKV